MNTNTMKRSWIVCWAVVFVFGVLAASVSQAADGGCGASVDADGTVHIPEVNVNGAIYWATLRLAPSQNGAIMLKASDYGPVAQPQCANSQRTFYVASEGASRVFIPTVQYAGSNSWVLLELVPSTDGLLWFKVTGYGPGGDWSGEAGAFLATMQVEVSSSAQDDLQMFVQGRSPLGLEVDFATDLVPNQPAPSVTHEEWGTAPFDTFELAYTVPYSDLPPELVARLRATSTTPEEGSGAGVVIVGALKEQGKNTVEHIAETAFGEAGKAVAKAGGSLWDLYEAWEVGDKHKEMMKQLNELQECAEHPAIPYFSPEDKDRTLAALRDIRFDIQANTAVRFVGMLNSAAAGLVEGPLGVVVGGVNAKVDETLDQFDRDDLNHARNLASCPVTWSGTFTADKNVHMSYCVHRYFKVTGEATFEQDHNIGVTSSYKLKSGHLTVTWTSKIDELEGCHDNGILSITDSSSSVDIPLKSVDITLSTGGNERALILKSPDSDLPQKEITTTESYCGSYGCGSLLESWDAPSVINDLMDTQGDFSNDLNTIVLTSIKKGNYFSSRWVLNRSPQLKPPPH